MHFAFPPRKSSNPPPYARSAPRAPFLRRGQLRSLAPLALLAIAAIWLLSVMFGGGGGGGGGSGEGRIPFGTPSVVVVTVFDLDDDAVFIERVQQNRMDYAARHGVYHENLAFSCREYETPSRTVR